MRVKVTGIEHGIEGVAPFRGSSIRFDTRMTNHTSHFKVIKDVIENEDAGIIIHPSDFHGKYRMMLDFCKKVRSKNLQVAFVISDYHEFLTEIGEFSVSETRMDGDALTQAMFTDVSDLYLPIGGSILDYYVEQYFIIEPERTFLVTGDTMYGSED